jgi:GxxExxY protein
MVVDKRDPKSYAIIGAAMEVHREIGCGFLERVYQESLGLELSSLNIQYRREVQLPVHYKKQLLGAVYIADFICFESIIVEVKALSQLSGLEQAQLINYLKITGYKTGLLINFGAPSLEYKRIIL